MSLLVRKIERAKWMQNDRANEDNIPADAITGGCVRTQSNSLSTWEIRDRQEVDAAVLAIVSKHNHLESFDVVWMDCDFLQEQGIRIEASPGITPVTMFSDRHMDLRDLNYNSLGVIARHIANNINRNNTQRYTAGQLKKILKAAIEAGDVDINALSPSLSQKIQNSS